MANASQPLKSFDRAYLALLPAAEKKCWPTSTVLIYSLDQFGVTFHGGNTKLHRFGP